MPFLLADDLSGALEAGAAFRARGWRVRLPLEEDEQISGEAGELAVISTESRNLKPEDAATRVRQALNRGAASGTPLLCKKIDSTLRGPIGAEIKALIAALEPPLVLVCAANPLVGRTVSNGILHVNGVPLEQSDFRHDPVWPAATGDIRVLLRKQGIPDAELLTLSTLRDDPVSALNRLYSQSPRKCRVLVADATTMEDITTLVDVVSRTVPRVVWVGSGALGGVLANKMAGPVTDKVSCLEPMLRMLLLCGSRHPSSLLQIDHLQQTKLARVIEVEVSPGAQLPVAAINAALLAAPVTAIRFSIEPTIKGAAETTMACAADLASAIEQNCPVAAWYLTGGETAAVVCRALGGKSLEIIRELEPGVVVSILRRKLGSDLTVVIKPGGFGSPQALAVHLQMLMS